MSVTQFMSDVDQKNIREIEVYGMEVRGKYRDNRQFHTTAPTNYFTPEMLKNLHDQGVLIKFRDINSGNIPLTLLGTWAPLILLGALWFFMIRQMQTGGNKALSFRRARLLSMRQQFEHEVNFTNIPHYPKWNAYLRDRQPKSLIVWGRNDPVFSAAAPEIIKKALPAAELRYFDGGHFVLDEYADEVADAIIETFC